MFTRVEITEYLRWSKRARITLMTVNVCFKRTNTETSCFGKVLKNEWGWESLRRKSSFQVEIRRSFIQK